MVIRRTAQWREGPRERLRVLIEDPAAEWFDEFVRYRCSGLEAAVCTGPDDAGRTCPHLRGRPCELWAQADVVFFALPRDEPAARMVLKAGRRAYPGKRVVFDLTREAGSEGPDNPVASASSRISAILSGASRETTQNHPAHTRSGHPSTSLT